MMHRSSSPYFTASAAFLFFCLLCITTLAISTSFVTAGSPPVCSSIGPRRDCGYYNQQACQQNGCCWSPVNPGMKDGEAAEAATADTFPQKMPTSTPAHRVGDTPWCFSPIPTVGGYYVSGFSATTAPGYILNLTLYDGFGMFGDDLQELQVWIAFESEERLNVKIYDPNNARWEIPESILPVTPLNVSIDLSTLNYEFSWTTQPFGFAVVRVSDGAVLVNTTPPVVETNNGEELAWNGLVFEDQYLSLTTVLPPYPVVYGLGEKVTSLQLNTSNNLITFWARDAADTPNQNIYGSHAFYLEARSSPAPNNPDLSVTRTHGMWLRNSNGMDVLLQDEESTGIEGTGALTYRVIGGVLDFYIYVGNDAPLPGVSTSGQLLPATQLLTSSSPESIIQQYHISIGYSHMPPFWSLGWHQCRWGYHTLSAVQAMVAAYATAKIPLDTAWTDIDYMNQYMDFTTDPVRFPQQAFAEFIDQLHQNGQHYMMIVDPAISNSTGYQTYESGVEQDVFIRRSESQGGGIFIGSVWPGPTAFPAFFSNATIEWWTNQIVEFRANIPVDGLWIDMNEASNFCDGECGSENMHRKKKMPRAISTPYPFDPSSPPYRINNAGDSHPLHSKTLDMDTTHTGTIGPDGNPFLEYNVHNMYGYSESIATRIALESTMQQRSLVVSRSTFPGSGAHVSHWLGDNWSTFPSMAYSIAGILTMNMYAINMVGADICGFNANTTEELCARWSALGAFYPFARNHNSKGLISQEPYRWPVVASIARNALLTRYSLLHIYNTLFFHANQQGGTVMKSVMFNFASDTQTFPVQDQMMLGSVLLITPVLEQGAQSVEGYFPQLANDGSVQVWYDYYTLIALPQSESGWITLEAPYTDDYLMGLHISGGSILLTQQPNLTTTSTLLNPFTMIIAPSSSIYQTYENQTTSDVAQGDIFFDNGLSLTPAINKFQAQYTFSSDSFLQYTVIDASYSAAQSYILEEVLVLNVQSEPTQVLLNGEESVGFVWNSDGRKNHVKWMSRCEEEKQTKTTANTNNYILSIDTGSLTLGQDFTLQIVY